jgi:hypothetical protein
MLLATACGQAKSHGEVDGYFRLPGTPAGDLQRGGLSFLPANGNRHRRTGVLGFLFGHGSGHGHVAMVGSDGRDTVTLSPGSYTVIGGLSRHPGGPVPERCAARTNVVVTADRTTRLDYACHATPVTSSKRVNSPTTQLLASGWGRRAERARARGRSRGADRRHSAVADGLVRGRAFGAAVDSAVPGGATTRDRQLCALSGKGWDDTPGV